MAELTCGVTERVASRAEARAALQTNRPYYLVRTVPPGFTLDQVAAAVEEGCARWTREGVNVTIRRITDLAMAGPNDVVDVIDAAALGPGVLADQTLGNGVTTRHQMRVSTRIDWERTNLADVMMHELGHFWGLAHFSEGPPPEVMEPRLSTLKKPQATEVAVAQKHFSQFPPIEPAPDPTPTPTPKPGNCCFRFKQGTLTARIPMNLTPEQQQALAKLDCAALLKGLLDRFLAGAIASLCPQAAQQANQEKPS